MYRIRRTPSAPCPAVPSYVLDTTIGSALFRALVHLMSVTHGVSHVRDSQSRIRQTSQSPGHKDAASTKKTAQTCASSLVSREQYRLQYNRPEYCSRLVTRRLETASEHIRIVGLCEQFFAGVVGCDHVSRPKMISGSS